MDKKPAPPPLSPPPAAREGETRQIVEKLTPMLKPEHRVEAVEVITTLIKSHQGPLPAPEDLQEYEDTCEGAANRIICMAERSQAHREAIEMDYIDKSFRLQTRGQSLALLALILMLAVVAFTFWIGQPIYGTVLGSGTIIAVVGMFLARGSEAAESTPAKDKAATQSGKQQVEHQRKRRK